MGPLGLLRKNSGTWLLFWNSRPIASYYVRALSGYPTFKLTLGRLLIEWYTKNDK